MYAKLPLLEVRHLQREEKLSSDLEGYSFFRDNEEWREFHVDDCKEFFDILMDAPLEERYREELTENDPRYLPMGHDEALAHQFDFSKKAWRGTKGQQSLRPKGRGKLYMMSGVISRVFLWDPEVSQAQLDEINETRRGKTYIDEEAAIEVSGLSQKPLLEMANLPFLKFVEVRTGSGGWWNGANMHLQLEDLADCCKVLYPGYQLLFFTDWSQGHARKRPDGLDASRMNKGFGGTQVRCHESMLNKDCFGPYTYPGMLPKPTGSLLVRQSFLFLDNNVGPCWMTPSEQVLNKYDRTNCRQDKERVF